MTIALVAHDNKKELMIRFCIAYYGMLSKCDICATDTTGKLVSEATGLNIARFFSGAHGGVQQIASRISCNEIDMLFFFRDTATVMSGEIDGNIILRLCDVHNIPIATNIATAEVLVHAMEHSDLDWRDIVKPTQLYFGKHPHNEKIKRCG